MSQWTEFNPFQSTPTQSQWTEFDPFAQARSQTVPIYNSGFGDFGLDQGRSVTPFFDMPSQGPLMSSGYRPPQFQTPSLVGPDTRLFGPDTMLGSLWNKVSSPLSTIPSQVAGAMNKYSDIGDEYSYGSAPNIPSVGNKLVQAGGDIASSMTSPLNLGLGVAGGVRSAALRALPYAENPAGIAAVADLATKATKGMSIPVLGHGLATVTDPEASWTDRAFGALETLGGMAGFRARNPFSVRYNPVTNKEFFALPEAPYVDTLKSAGRSSTVGRVADDLPKVDNLPDEIVVPEDVTDEVLAMLHKQGYEISAQTNGGYIFTKGGMKSQPVTVKQEEISQDFGSPEDMQAELEWYQMKESNQGLTPDESARKQELGKRLDPNFNQGEGDPEMAGYSGEMPTNFDPSSNELDFAGETIMTGERVTQLYGVSPKEAIKQGLVIQEGSGYRALVEDLDPYTLDDVKQRMSQSPDQQIRLLLKDMPNEQLIEYAQSMKEFMNQGGELNEEDLIHMQVVAEELVNRRIPMVDSDSGQDVLAYIDPSEDILASRILPFGQPTIDDITKEIAKRQLDPNTKDQIKFLVSNGQMREAMAVLNELPTKGAYEIKEPVELDHGWNIPLDQTTNVQSFQPLMAYNFPHDPSPIGESPAGKIINAIQPTGNLEFDNMIARMQELYNKPRIEPEDMEEIRQLGTVAMRHPAAPPGLRKEYYLSSSKSPTKLGPRPYEKGEISQDFFGTVSDDLFKGSKGEGLGKEPFDKQWEQSIQEAEQLGINWKEYDNLDQLQWDITRKIAQETVRTGKNPLAKVDPDEPQFARVPGGGIKIGVNVERAADELTTGYSGPLQAIMVREGLQNAIDAVKDLGGNVTIKIGKMRGPDYDGQHYIEIIDDGPGMTMDQIETVFTDLHESGKTKQGSATGGKGIGKATYMLGGDLFSAETITRKPNGKFNVIGFEGTKNELYNEVNPQEFEVDPTPDMKTGTSIRVILKPDQDVYYAEDMIRNIMEYSRDLDIPITYEDKYTNSNINKIKKTADDKIVYEGPLGDSNDVTVSVNGPLGEKSWLYYRVLNNGMYQYSKEIYLGDKDVPDIPKDIIVNVKPKAEEGTAEYPFGTQRESIKDELVKELEENIIKKYITDPQKKKLGDKLKISYDKMVSTAPQGMTTVRKALIYDPNDQMTPDELRKVQGNPAIQQLIYLIDNFVESSMISIGDQKMYDKLEGVGIGFLDDSIAGIHIPNPGQGKSSILINPFSIYNTYGKSNTGEMAATTILHEIAHVNTEKRSSDIKISSADINNPGIGQYFQHFLREVIEQGGLDHGHGIQFIHNLTEAFAKTSSREFFDAASRIQSIVNGKEFSEALRIYNESRGRSTTTKDPLIGTGIKSTNNSRSDSEGNVPSLTEGRGSQATGLVKRWEAVKSGNPLGDLPDPSTIPPEQRPDYLNRAFDRTAAIDAERQKNGDKDYEESMYQAVSDFLRSYQTAFDLSAPFRQGLGAITYKAWWTSWDDMVKALGSEESYKQIMDSIYNHPSGLFNDRPIPIMRNGRPVIDRKTGQPMIKFQPSWASMAGIDMTDLKGRPEEIFKSKLAQRIPIIGMGVKASSRGFSAFLNKTRADMFVALVEASKKMGRDPRQNPYILKQLGEFINNATGRGKLGLNIPRVEIPFGRKVGIKMPVFKERQFDFEGNAKFAAEIFYAPKLFSSRVKTYSKVFNPYWYKQADPFIRNQYLRSFFGIVATGLVISNAFKEMAEWYDEHGVIEIDPRSSDFGKVKFGDTRYDPFGGYQQPFVAAARMIMGESKSSMSNKISDLTTGGYGKPSRKDIAERFFANKFSPIMGIVWSWMEGKDFTGLPFNAKVELQRQLIPLIAQDLTEIYGDFPGMDPMDPIGNLQRLPKAIQDNPAKVIQLAPAFFGVGVQKYGDRKRTGIDPGYELPQSREPR